MAVQLIIIIVFFLGFILAKLTVKDFLKQGIAEVAVTSFGIGFSLLLVLYFILFYPLPSLF
jgi:hypothetical protein